MVALTKILIVVEAEIATTHLVKQVLHAAHQYGVVADLIVSSQWRERELPSDVTPLFVRCADPSMLPYARALVRHGRPYLYYIDDDFWSLDPSTPLGAYYSEANVLKSLNYFVSHAALVLTSAVNLAHRLKLRAYHVAVVPTFFNFELLEGIVPERTDEIRIGFAGSAGRQADLALIKPAIAPVLASHPRVVFEFIGAAPIGVGSCQRIRVFPPMENYDHFIRFQASRNWSIGLAPLLPNKSNQSKTDNKFREYSACSIAGIYSEFGPYPEVVTDGVDGMLVRNYDWTRPLLDLLGMPERISAMRSAARITAINRYDIGPASKIWAQSIIGTVQSITKGPPVDLTAIRRKVFFQSLFSRWTGLRMAYRLGGWKLVFSKSIRWFSSRCLSRGERK